MKSLKFVSLLVVAVVLSVGQVAVAAPELDVQEGQKAILVTGASSGIGLKVTEYLAAAGHFVYAGARKEKDLAALNEIPNVQSIRLDVTVQSEIDAAVAHITAEGRGLYGLVNNAGVAIVGPLMDVTDDDFHFQMNVNVYGPFRVTKAFGPLIVESQGRITTIGSIAGTITPAGLGPYCMSKHAMEAFTDALAAEMAPQGVVVNIVEPGNYKSKISESAYQRLITEKIAAGEELTPAMQEMQNRGPSDRSQYKDPDEVAAAVMLALFSENPKRRYMVVPSQEEAEWTIRKAVLELVQLNGDQPYAYSRDALIEMLDEAMAAEAE
jgi:NAD(P)-dependent dehydrogenase (short-subunit alcohol dehydrogenase family)